MNKRLKKLKHYYQPNEYTKYILGATLFNAAFLEFALAPTIGQVIKNNYLSSLIVIPPALLVGYGLDRLMYWSHGPIEKKNLEKKIEKK